MEARAIYETIVLDVPAGIDGKVMDILENHRGKDARIGRVEMVKAVFGVDLPSGVNLANNRKDRQIREAIERLRQRHIILSSSGEGGYWLPASLAEVEEYTGEIVSRARKLEEQARKLEQMAVAAFGSQMGLGF